MTISQFKALRPGMRVKVAHYVMTKRTRIVVDEFEGETLTAHVMRRKGFDIGTVISVSDDLAGVRFDAPVADVNGGPAKLEWSAYYRDIEVL